MIINQSDLISLRKLRTGLENNSLENYDILYTACYENSKNCKLIDLKVTYNNKSKEFDNITDVKFSYSVPITNEQNRMAKILSIIQFILGVCLLALVVRYWNKNED